MYIIRAAVGAQFRLCLPHLTQELLGGAAEYRSFAEISRRAAICLGRNAYGKFGVRSSGRLPWTGLKFARRRNSLELAPEVCVAQRMATSQRSLRRVAFPTIGWVIGRRQFHCHHHAADFETFAPVYLRVDTAPRK